MIIGIDPGTKCGWALMRDDGTLIASGVWDLSPRRHESGGWRYVKVRQNLHELVYHGCENHSTRVHYEEVRRHAGTDAAHIYGGIVATIQAFCVEREIDYCGVPVGTVKKLATGKGNADKSAMLAAANARWPNMPTTDDNEADARFIALAGVVDNQTAMQDRASLSKKLSSTPAGRALAEACGLEISEAEA